MVGLSGQGPVALVSQSQPIAGLKRVRGIPIDPIQLDGAVDQLEPVGVPTLPGQGQQLTLIGLCPPEANRSIDGHGALALVWVQQRCPVLVDLDVALLVGRLKIFVEGCNPDLQKATGRVTPVDLAVHDAGAGAHAFTSPARSFLNAHGIRWLI